MTVPVLTDPSREHARSTPHPKGALRVKSVGAAFVRDTIALTKPRITMTVLFTAFGGYWLGAHWITAQGDGPAPTTHAFWPMLIGTILIVSGANALNMFIERDTDAFMDRTRSRPLPSGRLSPDVALAVGVLCAALALPILGFMASPMTALLAAIAFGSYVFVYTPMKRRSTVALLVGAVPGAIPPLLGWSAVRGSADGPAWVLFAILALWQIPHFLAIATFRKEDYRRAGLKVLPVVSGDRVTRHHVVRYLAALVMTSYLLVPFGIGGVTYVVAATLLGALFFGVGLLGLRARTFEPTTAVRWARRLFGTSMVYLMGIYAALLLASCAG